MLRACSPAIEIPIAMLLRVLTSASNRGDLATASSGVLLLPMPFALVILSVVIDMLASLGDNRGSVGDRSNDPHRGEAEDGADRATHENVGKFRVDDGAAH